MVVNFWWLCDAFKAEFIVHSLKWDTTEGGKAMCYPGKTLSSICWKKKKGLREREISPLVQSFAQEKKGYTF